jgi:hypothetical protein
MITLKKRFVVAAAVLALATPAAFARSEGTDLHLQSIPPFMTRLFIPVVPGVANTFKIEGAPVTQVLHTPTGYAIERFDGGVRIQSTAAEGQGYARVRAGGRDLTLALITLVPYSKVRGGFLEGYRIGEYLLRPLRGLAQYERPKGFIRLTKDNADLQLSDHYTLSHFQCKLDGKSKYLVVRPEALIKLELMQNLLESGHGLKFARFTIMSGYRTPFYNRMIGNETGYSRHLYGDAMDIYIDRDNSGAMDDINRDGRVDSGDAKFLLKIAETIDKSKEWSWLKGGAGVYHANAAHGPYIHVDTRGFLARWGV